jgi:hypothetical protein
MKQGLTVMHVTFFFYYAPPARGRRRALHFSVASANTISTEPLCFLNVTSNCICKPLACPYPQHRLLCTLKDYTLTTTFALGFCFSRSPFKVRLQLLNRPLRVKVHPRPMGISNRPRRASVWPLQHHLQQALSCWHCRNPR